ncbi:MAG TPA: restriction endonuclease subunit S [Candidatus Sulfotelmatobacter sp.]|nr:restriction endonuclease subunit S [Candidatus Sulfotelmatobacter sp.]
MTIQEKLWWCLCLRANRFRFNFGRQANRTIGSLSLPDSVPEWVSTLELPSHNRNGVLETVGDNAIDTSSWAEFKLSDVFSMQTGEHIMRRNLGRGTTPFVSASAWNNGVTAEVAVRPDWNGGQITIANNGSIGAAFYQPRPFTASRDVTVLEPRVSLSAAAALFVCTVLRKESARFNYARKWNYGRMKDSVIRLPAKESEPDVLAMEQFMRNLHLGWAL